MQPFLKRAGSWVAFGLSLCGGVDLNAQEVSVGRPGLFPGDQPVEQMPRLKQKLDPRFPAEMLSAQEIGYVMMFLHWDEGGKIRAQNIMGTVHPYRVEVERAAGSLRVEPAVVAGRRAPVWGWIPVIFNPATAAANLPDATPRLLEVVPVVVPAQEIEDAPGGVVAAVRLTVNTSGRAERIAVESADGQRFQKHIEAGLALWKFSPARRAGQPVEAEITLPVLINEGLLSKTDRVGKSTPPKPIKMGAPVYPPGLVRSGLRGEVVVEMIINDQGGVQDAVVFESNNPGFNEAALQAVLKWTFVPAKIDGRPVDTRVKQLIVFQLEGRPGRDAFKVTKSKASLAAENAEFQPDVYPKPRGTAAPVYPYESLSDRVPGSATVTLLVNERGEGVRVTVDKATRPEFGFALAAALETFAFNPALKQGKPIPSTVTMTHHFRVFDSSAITPNREYELARREENDPAGIVQGTELDRPLKVLSQQAPKFPLVLAKGTPGRAEVEILVDETGRACLPRIISATHPAFGYAAVQAVSAWRFEVPKKKGKAVIVRVRIPVDFSSKVPASPEGEVAKSARAP